MIQWMIQKLLAPYGRRQPLWQIVAPFFWTCNEAFLLGIFEGGDHSGELPVMSICTCDFFPPSHCCRGIRSDLRVVLNDLFLFSHFNFSKALAREGSISLGYTICKWVGWKGCFLHDECSFRCRCCTRCWLGCWLFRRCHGFLKLMWFFEKSSQSCEKCCCSWIHFKNKVKSTNLFERDKLKRFLEFTLIKQAIISTMMWYVSDSQLYRQCVRQVDRHKPYLIFKTNISHIKTLVSKPNKMYINPLK